MIQFLCVDFKKLSGIRLPQFLSLFTPVKVPNIIQV